MVSACARYTRKSICSRGEYWPKVVIAWCTSMTDPPLWKHFPWQTVNVKAAFLQHLNPDIPVHDSSIGFDFECLDTSGLQGFNDVLYGLLAPILQGKSARTRL